MAANLLTGTRDGPGSIGVFLCPLSQQEKGGVHPVLLQGGQHRQDVPVVPGAVDADGSFFLRRLHRVDGQTAPVGSTECLFGRQKQAVAGKRSGESDQCKSDCTAKSGFQRASCTKNKSLHRNENPSFVPSLCGQRRVEHQTAYRADKKERTSRLKASGCLAAQKWSAPGRQTKRERGSEWAISRLC